MRAAAKSQGVPPTPNPNPGELGWSGQESLAVKVGLLLAGVSQPAHLLDKGPSLPLWAGVARSLAGLDIVLEPIQQRAGAGLYTGPRAEGLLQPQSSK